MPLSPASHRRERESQAAFELLLGDKFVYRREEPDYAIDGVAEEIDDEDRLTGLRFYVQLKSTADTDLEKALAISLKLADRDYYRSLSLPTLMVLYHEPTKTFYLRWVSEYDPYYGRGGKKTFTFRWQESDAWREGRADELIAEARVFREVRSPNPPLPRPLHVVSQSAFGLSETELLYVFRDAAESCSDVIEIRSGPPTDGAAWVEISEAEVSVNLAKVTGAVLHIDADYDPGELGSALAIDGLLMAAPAFANVDQFEIASRLISELAPKSLLLRDAGIAMALQGIMAGARRIRESLRIADQLDRSEDTAIRETSIAFTFPALKFGSDLGKEDAAFHRKTLRSRINRRKHDDDSTGAAREMVNLANLHRRRAEGRKAVHLYNEARKADPEYEQRAYYWHELGGVLWMERRYEEAANAYRRAIEIGGEPIADALYADCLMYAGQYAEARGLFETFNAAHPDLADEYRLKKIALDVIVDGLNIEDQQRDMEAAVKASPRFDNDTPAETIIAGSLRQLQLDALWSSAWYNLGVASGRSGASDKALLAFIAGTILMPEVDMDPWTHAIFYAWNAGEKDLLRDILMTARRQSGTSFLKALVKFTRQQIADFPGEELLREVDSILADSPVHHAGGYRIRLIGTEGVEEFDILD
jgi:tetratricopeptide (TPR) repeat protein